MKTQAFDINVGKGDGKASAMADYAVEKDKDIRTIKTGKQGRHTLSDQFFGSRSYWVSLLLPLIAFIFLLIIFRKRALDNADLGKMRGKKANKVATRRLRKASQLMQKGEQNAFYDEVLRALWGYVGDKMNMPVAELSRENIADKLSSYNVGETTVSQFLGALDECEFERYAPGDSTGNMNKTFSAAMTAIEQIEKTMKKSKKSRSKHSSAVSILVVLFYLLLSPSLQSSAYALTKQNADDEYKKGNYQQAIKDYEELIRLQPSADLYYNLGNAYYRTENTTQAILAYERALQLNPGDKDTRFNLEFARSKTIDKITPESEMFFFSWYRSLVHLMSVDMWARIAVASIVLALLLLLVYLFASRLWMRQVSFYGAIIFLLVFLAGNFFAWQQKQQVEGRRGAVITAPSVSVKKTPGKTGSDAYVLHEGTHVTITDRSIANWFAIRLDDGRDGWLPVKSVEEI